MISYRASIAALCLMASAVGAQGARIGAPVPDVDLPALAGGRVQIAKFRGHPIVVSFWGTWCPPCRDEFPELVRAHATYAPAGLYILGVNGRDQEWSTKDVQKFMKEFSATFPVALDEKGRARQSFGILGLPTTVFVDSAGVVRGLHLGPITREELERGIATILPAR